MLGRQTGKPSRCLVTGANGFLGSALVAHLRGEGFSVRGAMRQSPVGAGDWAQVKGLGADTDWLEALRGCDVVVHTAARAHVLHEKSTNPLTDFRQVNVAGTLSLAEQALSSGVSRFVFISSIGVNGLKSARAFTELDMPEPHSFYAQTKLEAEVGLQSLVNGRSMELVIIRPPLVYAAHAPGNFRRLLKLIATGLPIPLASLDNKRSMVALDNLMTLIEACTTHPDAANELFLAADGDDFSIGEIVSLLARGMGRDARLWSVPASILSAGALMLGRKSLYTQLCESLQVDASKSRRVLGWQPRISAREALLLAGQKYVALAE